MKRLSGGIILLNLTAISLNFTAGEVSITDAGILEELTELRNFIDVNRDFNKGFKNLKPVLIEYRSSASKVNGVANCNMTFHTDALHMSIAGYSIQSDGTPICITINVVYEWVDYLGYQVKTAKLNATSGLTIDIAEYTGDIDITGDLSVSGKISGGEIVENMSGYSGSIETDFDGVYMGIVKNGNKLTLVACAEITPAETLPATLKEFARFVIPASIGAKLYDRTIGAFSYALDVQQVIALSSIQDVNLMGYIEKTSGTSLKIYLKGCENLVATRKYFIRYEATFLLSDNLIGE